MLETKGPRRKLPLPVLLFAGVSLLNEISAQMVAPLIPVLLATGLAAGPVVIGLVEGVADAAAAFFKLWSGRQADLRPDRRKAMVVAGYALALVARPLIGLAGHWSVVIGLRATDRLGKGLRGAPRDAILADATPSNMQGRAYGLNRGMDYAGAVVGTLIAAAVLAWSGLAVEQVILWSAVPGVAVLGLLVALPSRSGQTPAPAAQVARVQLSWRDLSPELRHVLVAVAGFSMARASEAFIVLRGHELGQSVVQLLLLWAWLAALQSLTALVAAPWTDRIEKRRLVPRQWVGMAIGYTALAGATTTAGLWLAVSLYGVLSGASEGVERALVSEMADADRKGTAFGWYHLLTGVGAIAAGLLIGGLWQLAGASLAFAAAAALTLVCSVWLGQSPARRERGQETLRP